MKTNIFKAAYFLLGLLLVNVNAMHASAGEKFDKFVGNEFSSFQGIYIIIGVVVTSLVLYLVVNHFNKQEEEHGTVRHGSHYSHHRRHHHHAHKVIKKTS